MVFNLASNFEFSTASISTTWPWLGGEIEVEAGERVDVGFGGFEALGGVARS
jgi:hypothetical protein